MKEPLKEGCGGTPPPEAVSNSPGPACGCDDPVVRETPSCCGTAGAARAATVEATCKGLPQGLFIDGWVDTPVGPLPRVTTRIGPGFFSASAAWQKGGPAAIVLLKGILGSAVLTPLLLPWLPGKAFSAKGALVGGVLAASAVLFFGNSLGAVHALPVLLALPAISSFVAMNFTGATPFTSPSGVEKEMRSAIPVQAIFAVLAMVTWVGGAFLR